MAPPADWQVVRLHEIADYRAGRTPARANPAYWCNTDEGVPWVSISDMDKFGTVVATKENISKRALADVFGGRMVSAGTLIMSFKLTIGRVATLGLDACHNEAIISIFPSSGIDQRYLGYFLAHVDYDGLQDRQVKGNTLNQDKINRIEVWLPELREQNLIADVLDLLRRAIDVQRGGLAAAQSLKRAAMCELFSRGLRGEPPKETEFGRIPDSWRLMPLDECAFIQTGAAKGRAISDDEAVQVPYLRVANVQDGHLDLSEMKEIKIRKSEVERYRLQPGDVVLTEGGDFDKLGRGFVWRGELDLCIHQNHVFAVRPDRSQLLPEFLAYLCQSSYGKAYFLKVAHKTTNLACINSAKLKAFPVAFPDLDEQREIVAILDHLDRKNDLHKRKRKVLEDLFETLLHKLMTGEIRVSDLDLSALERSAAAS